MFEQAPEPWKPDADEGTINDAKGHTVATVLEWRVGIGKINDAQVITNHIIACVNALEGIDPAAVPLLRIACEEAASFTLLLGQIGALDGQNSNLDWSKCIYVRDKCRDALAAAKGGIV